MLSLSGTIVLTQLQCYGYLGLGHQLVMVWRQPEELTTHDIYWDQNICTVQCHTKCNGQDKVNGWPVVVT